MLILQCSPPRALWTLSLPRKCLNPKKLEVVGCLASCELVKTPDLMSLSETNSFTDSSAFVDFYLTIYPAVELWKLHMPKKKKAGPAFAVGMGVAYVEVFSVDGVW